MLLLCTNLQAIECETNVFQRGKAALRKNAEIKVSDIENGNTSFICALLKRKESDANEPIFSSSKVLSPLHWAAKYNKPEIVKLLIKAGADINAPDSYSGFTPLHRAAANNSSRAAKALIEEGAGIEAVDQKYSRTPLHVSAIYDANKVATTLIRDGANTEAKDKDGNTPHALAVFNKSNLVIEAIRYETKDCGYSHKHASYIIKDTSTCVGQIYCIIRQKRQFYERGDGETYLCPPMNAATDGSGTCPSANNCVKTGEDLNNLFEEDKEVISYLQNQNRILYEKARQCIEIDFFERLKDIYKYLEDKNFKLSSVTKNIESRCHYGFPAKISQKVPYCIGNIVCKDERWLNKVYICPKTSQGNCPSADECRKKGRRSTHPNSTVNNPIVRPLRNEFDQLNLVVKMMKECSLNKTSINDSSRQSSQSLRKDNDKEDENVPSALEGTQATGQ